MLTAKLILLHVLANEQAALADRTKVNPDQAYCLAQNIYHEARGESIAGQFAVAHTTLNRVKASNYPQTVCGVVMQAVRDSKNRPVRNKCQFSWYCDEASDYISVSKKDGKLSGNAESFEIAATVAIMALAGSGVDNTRGATHYYNPSLANPRWANALATTTVYGNHKFMRER